MQNGTLDKNELKKKHDRIRKTVKRTVNQMMKHKIEHCRKHKR